jgi:hypothetical protein
MKNLTSMCLATHSGTSALPRLVKITRGYEDPYVHPPIAGRVGMVHLTHPAVKNPCANLTPAGCSLVFDRRPTQCRVLVPDPAGKVCRLPSSVSDEAC